MSLSRQSFIPITQYSDSPIFRQFADVRAVQGLLLEIVARLYAAPVLWNSLPNNYRNCSNFNEFKNLISFWNGKSYTCIACQNSYLFVRGGIPKLSVFCFLFVLLYIIILFVCFILCFALLCCYVSLHYVLPALQFICACLIFMNIYMCYLCLYGSNFN